MSSQPTSTPKRRRLVAVAAGVAVAAIVSASAATLGGLSADKIGADSTVVLDSADGLRIEWDAPEYSQTVGGYVIDGLTLQSENLAFTLPATADGATVRVALFDDSGALVAESTAASGGGTSYDVTFSADVDVHRVERAVAYVSE